MTTEIIRYHLSPELAAQFPAAYAEAGKILDRSPDCHGYEILRGVEEPNRFLVVIRWTSVERHLEGFRKSPDFRPFFALVRPFFDGIEEMKHYDAC